MVKNSKTNATMPRTFNFIEHHLGSTNIYNTANTVHENGSFYSEELFVLETFALSSGIHNSQVSTLVLLCKLGDGLVEAVEPGVGGDQHQEGHGDNLHCAGGEKQSIVR